MTYIPILAEAGLSEMSGTTAVGFMLAIFAMWFLTPIGAIRGPSYSMMTYAQPVILVLVVLAAAVILRRRKVRMWIRIPIVLILYSTITFGTNVLALAVVHPRAFAARAKRECTSILTNANSPAELAKALSDTNQFAVESGVFVELANGEWVAIVPRADHSVPITPYYALVRDSSGAWFESRHLTPYSGIATIIDGKKSRRRPEGTTLAAVQAELIRQGFERMQKDANNEIQPTK